MAKKQRQDIEINSWEEWFESCGTMYPYVVEYQDRLFGYELLMYGKKDVDTKYVRRHKKEFWLEDSIITKHIAKCLGIGFLVLTGLAFVLLVVMGCFKAPESVSLSLIIEMMQKHFVKAFIIGLILDIIGFGGYVLRRKFMIDWFKDMNEYLDKPMHYIPPKYRNAFCLDGFFKFYANYGIENFQQALDVCDEYIRQAAGDNSYVPVHIMADVPYTSNMAESGPGSVSVGDDGDPVVTSDALPKDIKSHTRSGVENADEALNEMIGLVNVKNQVQQMKRRIEFYDGSTSSNSGNNTVLLGAAGSGKTEIARILTKIFYDFGYISKNRIVEVDGEYLKSPYVGQTGERTSAIIEWSLGGVLFIDEAYLLFNEKDNSSVGAEATGVLLKAMEDHRDDFIVILAGYEDGMNRLISSNEGFASRIKYKIYFDPYSDEELTQIFELFLKKSGQKVDKIDPDARKLLKKELDAESKLGGFGNARASRNACDALLDIHADRFIDGLTPEDKKDTITLGDVEAFVEMQRKKFAADGRNFMATSHLDQSIMSMSELRSRTKRGVKDWRRSMAALVGMENIKEQMQALHDRAEFFSGDVVHEEDEIMDLNTLFIGPPGVGKSTVASIFTSMLYELGYVRDNSYLDITGDFLKASYVGQTGKRTEAVIEYSKGMVLFIDEAYLLMGDGNNNFGAEAMGVLVDAMEKNRGELVIIFAGYDREMNALLRVNSGLSSRIANVWHFNSYSPKELCQIFARMAAQRKFKVAKECWGKLRALIEQNINDPMFGNARFVRQVLQASISQHATRYAKGLIAEADKFVLEPDDITNAEV